MNKLFRNAAALAALALVGAGSYAAIVFNNQGDVTFVPKGDVQAAFGWNNNQLQACITANCLTWETVIESGTSWRCIRNNNNGTVIQERNSVFTASDSATVTARQNNQVTGFFLVNSTVVSNTPSGSPAFSCPSGTGWAVVSTANVADPCGVIDAQGNFSSTKLPGCTTDGQGRAYWTTGGGTTQLRAIATPDPVTNSTVTRELPILY
jgi:hypothetical protein